MSRRAGERGRWGLEGSGRELGGRERLAVIWRNCVCAGKQLKKSNHNHLL